MALNLNILPIKNDWNLRAALININFHHKWNHHLGFEIRRVNVNLTHLYRRFKTWLYPFHYSFLAISKRIHPNQNYSSDELCHFQRRTFRLSLCYSETYRIGIYILQSLLFVHHLFHFFLVCIFNHYFLLFIVILIIHFIIYYFYFFSQWILLESINSSFLIHFNC